MDKEFVGYTESLALKELGFDEPCLFAYNQDDENKLMTAPQFSSYQINSGKNSDKGELNKVTAPLYQQVFRWFREKYNLQSIIIPFAENSIDENSNTLYYYIINKKQFYGFVNAQEEIGFNSQEEAELECLKKLIEIVKQK